MNLKRIILEDRFTAHQKISLLLYIGAPFIIFIFFLMTMDLNYKGFFLLAFLILIYGLIICISFTKRGFVKINLNLYRGLFFRGKLILKKKIDLKDKSKLSILKFQKSQKLAWFAAARPDLATTFNSFEINILNERHTVREEIITLKKEQSAEKAIDFLTLNFQLKNEVYCPRF